MKKILLIITIFLVCFSTKVFATTSSDYQYWKPCDTYEVSEATASGGLNEIGCYKDFESAKAAMIRSGNENAVVVTIYKDKLKIVAANYALVREALFCLRHTSAAFRYSNIRLCR